MAENSAGSKGKLAAIVGTAAATIITAGVMLHEGKRNVPYRDIGGVWTVCYGDTNDVEPGRRYTDAECAAKLELRTAEAAAGVKACVPTENLDPEQVAAFVDFAYNAGVHRFCTSTIAKRLRDGNVPGACEFIAEYRRAGGLDCFLEENRRLCGGIKSRRMYEVGLCKGVH